MFSWLRTYMFCFVFCWIAPPIGMVLSDGVEGGMKFYLIEYAVQQKFILDIGSWSVGQKESCYLYFIASPLVVAIT